MKNLKTFLTWIAPIIGVILFFSMANADFGSDGKKTDCESEVEVQSLPKDYDCSQRDAVHPLEWANQNPETIDQSETVTVLVTGGKSPYEWSVDGTGFELAQAATSSGSNKLASGDSACGPATIEVTDDAGQKVIGYVRCNEGQWVRIKIDHSCNWGWNSSVWCESTEGKYFYRVYAAHGAHSPCVESCIHFYCAYNPCDYCHLCGTPSEQYIHIGSTSYAEVFEWICR